MARSPRAKVSATAGQGVSRLSYQRGYALRGGDAPKVKGDFPKGEKPREYGKGKSKTKAKSGLSYGDPLPESGMKKIKKFAEKGG